jgi:hypothetical protein
VRRFCEQSIEEVQTSLPTVLLHVVDAAGHDVNDVRVLVDGAATAALDGRPLTMDPGPHVLRFEPREGPPLEDRLLIVESQKNRLVTETLGTATPPAPPGGSAHVPAGAWILGGVAVAGLATFTGLAVSGQSTYSGCVTVACSASTKSTLNVERAVAWASLGVGAAALAGSLGVYFSSRSSALGVTASPTGAAVSLSARF